MENHQYKKQLISLTSEENISPSTSQTKHNLQQLLTHIAQVDALLQEIRDFFEEPIAISAPEAVQSLAASSLAAG